MPTMHIKRRSDILIKAVNSFLNKVNRETHERFDTRMLDICKKEKVSPENTFSVLFFSGISCSWVHQNL